MISYRGDEEEYIRLLSSFQQQFPYKIQNILPIREHVFKIKTTEGIFILKGYSSYSKLKLQEAFTASLKKEGFFKSYSYLSLDQDPIVYKNRYYGCLEYIEPHHHSFTYTSENDRQEGLLLLDEFHQVTKNSVQRYQTIINNFEMQKKWEDRLNQFLQNRNWISQYVPKEAINEWIDWAKWSLEGINQMYEPILMEPDVILHGDVAHHNFIRGKNGKLYIIDFDLISIGPSSMDLLQYANRILPFIHWDINTLARYNSLKPLFNNRVYLYALAYPTDLLREWNRTIKDQRELNALKLQQVLNQSFYQMHLRQQFVTEIKKLIERT